jgi:hypothetical protein
MTNSDRAAELNGGLDTGPLEPARNRRPERLPRDRTTR